MSTGGAQLAVSSSADDRDRPLLRVELTTATGGTGVAAMSGAMSGAMSAHAVEGALRAVLPDVLASWGAGSQEDFDAALHDRRRTLAALLAETPTADAVGGGPGARELADAVIATASIASVRARALAAGTDLYRWMVRAAPAGNGPRLPVPGAVLVRGGRRSANRLDIAGVGVTPLGARSLQDAQAMTAEVHGALRRVLHRLGFAADPGPDGSLEPALQAPEDVMDLVVDAIEAVGYSLGAAGMAIDVDLAAGDLHAGGAYRLNGTTFDGRAWVDYLAHLVDRYPIWSMRGPTASDDPGTWAVLTETLAHRVQLVGDIALISAGTGRRRGPSSGIDDRIHGTAAAISVETSGTVTGAVRDARRSRAVGSGVVASTSRRGIADDFLADLSVALGCGQVQGPVGPDGRAGAVGRRLLQVADGAPELPFGLGSR